MKKLVSIGEALIDFIPIGNGRIKDIEAFEPHIGGAPSNVCGAYAKLGGQASIITQLGEDPFGDKIQEELKQEGVDTSCIARTAKANTSLAFVALSKDGNRQFSFYRNPGADMLLEADQIKEEWFQDAYALHFCSVDLGDFPMKKAHARAISYAKKNHALISFDPNVRLSLWKHEEDCRKAILEFLPEADILKISDEELEFITGKTKIEGAEEILFQGNVKAVVYTAGSHGASLITKNMHVYEPSLKVKALDTTGAGDGFIGSFLYQLSQDQINDLSQVTEDRWSLYLRNSASFCAESIQHKGAISSYPTSLKYKE
ncbi:MAG: carbohydrate kinase [Solobacterium sp.]|jgi:fructokinase|nr:carbohydrate kinase [Solobacterium sp.]MCH4206120.1 carbohydrate kinase [Solobacterium sp.]MCH4227586.1 carbohydrate kinase [Solobacterium sp.]MCH4283010.1 carbohydrate kinase [Solobacterium sp.]